MRAHPAQLRADFQRYYGLNLDGMGREYSVFHAADLAVCLPSESCCGVAEDPLNAWTIDRQLLALIEYYTHSWVWAHTKDAKSKRNEPKLRIPQPETGEGTTARGVERMTVDEMTDFMNGLIERKGGGDGGN